MTEKTVTLVLDGYDTTIVVDGLRLLRDTLEDYGPVSTSMWMTRNKLLRQIKTIEGEIEKQVSTANRSITCFLKDS